MVPSPSGTDPLWHKASTVIGGQFLVKFAWSGPAALRLVREIGVLTALAGTPYLPELVVASTDPVLLATRLVPGSSLFQVIDTIEPDQAAQQLARFLAALHRPSARERVETATSALPNAPLPPTAASELRTRLPPWIRPDQCRAVRQWCDWAEETLATPGKVVLVHGDLHGDNQVWQHDQLRLVVDFETVGLAEPEYELRAFPGPGMGPGVQLLAAVIRHYQHLAGRPLAVERILAWHLRNALHDVLWRSESGTALPDHRTPADWIDDLAERFDALDITPTARS